MTKSLTLSIALIVATTLPVMSNEFEQPALSYYKTQLITWASDPILLEALRESNATTKGRDADQTQELDQQWRAQVGTSKTSLIDPIFTNDASEFLRRQAELSSGHITEISLIDANGFNAGISSLTTDYFQGDEDQFNEVFPKGTGAVWISDVDFDESSQSYQVDVAMAITDPGTNKVLGTMTVSLNAEALK